GRRCVAKELERGAHGRGLGGRGEYGAESKVIGACPHGGARTLELVIAGGAQYATRETPARATQVTVLAPKVRARGVELERKLHIVVDDYRYAIVARHAHERSSLRAIAALTSVLEQRDAAFERKPHLALEIARLRSDRVEPAQLHRP